MYRDATGAKFPQVRLSFAEKCLILAEFCRELSAQLRCTQLSCKLHALHCGVTAAAAEI